jgi:hypothetical protein
MSDFFLSAYCVDLCIRNLFCDPLSTTKRGVEMQIRVNNKVEVMVNKPSWPSCIYLHRICMEKPRKATEDFS